MESGLVTVSEVDAAIYLTYCGVRKSELDAILDLVREPDTGTWLQEHGTRLPDELRTLVYHETTATSIAYYQPLNVPGLLQTEDYARAVFEFANVLPQDKIPLAVQTRLELQGILRRQNPPDCVFYLYETGLRAKVGSNRVMHEQLMWLVFLTSRPQHQIRVLPAACGQLGALAGPFMLMSFSGHAPVLYVQGLTTSLFLETPEHITAYRNILERLDRAALNTGESREWLARLASDYDQPEDGTDDEV